MLKQTANNIITLLLNFHICIGRLLQLAGGSEFIDEDIDEKEVKKPRANSN